MPPHLIGELLQHIRHLRSTTAASDTQTGSGLTGRDIEYVRLLAEGLSTAEIATELCYSLRTVKKHIFALNKRIHVHNRTHAVAYAIRRGLI